MENTNEETKAVIDGPAPTNQQLSFPNPAPEEEIDRKSARTKEINAFRSSTLRKAEAKEPITDPTQSVSGEWTYLVFDGKKHKIGKSNNPEVRVKSLRTANPSCILLGKTKKISEKDLHIIFRDKRVAGEWFDLSDEDLTKISGFFENGICPVNVDLAVHHFRRHRKESGYKKYVIGFGKYKGVKLIDMITPEQIDYLQWFVSEKVKNASRGELKRAPYQAFKWWIALR